MAKYTHNEEYEIYRFIVALRKAEFHQNNKLLFAYYYRKSNILGERLGYFIAPGVLGKKSEDLSSWGYHHQFSKQDW